MASNTDNTNRTASDESGDESNSFDDTSATTNDSRNDTSNSSADDTAGGNDPAAVTTKRGRGRPSGSGSGKSNSTGTGKSNTKKSVAVDHKVLGRQIVGLHLLAAVKTQTPELAITDSQGEDLAKVCADIVAEYGLTVSNKMALWVNLIMVTGSIYGPKIVAIKQRKSQPENPLAGLGQ